MTAIAAQTLPTQFTVEDVKGGCEARILPEWLAENPTYLHCDLRDAVKAGVMTRVSGVFQFTQHILPNTITSILENVAWQLHLMQLHEALQVTTEEDALALLPLAFVPSEHDAWPPPPPLEQMEEWMWRAMLNHLFTISVLDDVNGVLKPSSKMMARMKQRKGSKESTMTTGEKNELDQNPDHTNPPTVTPEPKDRDPIEAPGVAFEMLGRGLGNPPTSEHLKREQERRMSSSPPPEEVSRAESEGEVQVWDDPVVLDWIQRAMGVQRVPLEVRVTYLYLWSKGQPFDRRKGNGPKDWDQGTFYQFTQTNALNKLGAVERLPEEGMVAWTDKGRRLVEATLREALGEDVLQDAKPADLAPEEPLEQSTLPAESEEGSEEGEFEPDPEMPAESPPPTEEQKDLEQEFEEARKFNKPPRPLLPAKEFSDARRAPFFYTQMKGASFTPDVHEGHLGLTKRHLRNTHIEWLLKNEYVVRVVVAEIQRGMDRKVLYRWTDKAHEELVQKTPKTRASSASPPNVASGEIAALQEAVQALIQQNQELIRKMNEYQHLLDSFSVVPPEEVAAASADPRMYELEERVRALEERDRQHEEQIAELMRELARFERFREALNAFLNPK